MQIEELIEINERKLPEMLVDDHTKSTYIMQGNAYRKTLDTYHLILAPTNSCNLRCKHCYLPDHNNAFLPKEVVLKIIDEWSEIVFQERGQYGGIFHVKGGEPFVVPYLWDIVDRLAELQSLRFMITTNGTFIGEDIFERLRDCNNVLNGHVTIIVSLDGATEATNAILRGQGQFIKTLRFLEGIRKSGITFYLNCVLHRGNIYELSSYIDLAKQFGASQVNFLSFVPRGNGSSVCQFQVPHLEVYKHLNSIYENVDEETKELLAGSLPHIKHRETSGQYCTSHECVATYRGLFYITPDGSVFTCPNITFADLCVGNVHEQDLSEISANLANLYERVKTYSEAYLCTGEKMFYNVEEDVSRLKSLVNLRDSLDKRCRTSELISYPVSYCLSRNF